MKGCFYHPRARVRPHFIFVLSATDSENTSLLTSFFRRKWIALNLSPYCFIIYDIGDFLKLMRWPRGLIIMGCNWQTLQEVALYGFALLIYSRIVALEERVSAFLLIVTLSSSRYSSSTESAMGFLVEAAPLRSVLMRTTKAAT